MTRYVGRGPLFAILDVTLVALPTLLAPASASAFTMLTVQHNTNRCVRRYGAPVPSWHRHPG
ncbi:MAG TPA: hypothetical protein VHZ54_02340 [Solirubrobacterales bacterium]|nr:hypothetical protein [Solirubrobacterales bacterium]